MKKGDIIVRDVRNKQHLILDDEYLNGYAKVCGWNATLAYLCLCRHADKNQYAFPSIGNMAERVGISRDSIIRGLKILEECSIIKKEKVRSDESGRWWNNAYWLLDKSQWKRLHKKDQVAHSDVVHQVAHSDRPSRSQRLSQVAHSDTKEAQYEGGTSKEAHTLSAQGARDEVNDFISLFGGINPSYETLFPRKPQREAARRLLGKNNLDWWRRFFTGYQSVLESDSYMPVATTPKQLEDKLAAIMVRGKKLQDNKKPSVAIL